MVHFIDLAEGNQDIDGKVRILFCYTAADGRIIEGQQFHGANAWDALELFSDDIFDSSLLPPIDLNKPCVIILSKGGPS